MPVEREIAETDIVYKAHTRPELLKDVVRHGLLERRQSEVIQPICEISGCERGRLSDRLSGHAHRERFGLEPRPPTSRTRLGELVLPQEHPDVLFVPLCLEPLEKRENAEVPAALVMQEELALTRRDVLPGRVERDPTRADGLAQQPPAALVPWLGPRIEGTLGQ